VKITMRTLTVALAISTSLTLFVMFTLKLLTNIYISYDVLLILGLSAVPSIIFSASKAAPVSRSYKIKEISAITGEKVLEGCSIFAATFGLGFVVGNAFFI